MSKKSKTEELLQRELQDAQKRIARLEQVEQNTATIFNMSLDMICITEFKTDKLLTMNPAFQNALGFSEMEMLDRPILELVHPDDLPRTRKIVEEQLHSGKNIVQFENRIRTKQGGYRILSWMVRPIPAKGINLGLARDVTEQKQAEKSLQESEEWYRTLIETLPDPVIVYDLQGNFLSLSRQALKFYGVETFEQLYAEVKNIGDLLSEEDREKAFANFKFTLETGHSQNTQYRVRLKNGDTAMIEAHSSLLRYADGTPRGFISVIRDVTDRHQAQEAVRRSEERLALALSAVNDAVWDWNFVTEDVYFNPLYFTMIGYEPDEFSPSYKAWRNLLHPEDRERAERALNDYLEQRSPNYMVDFRVRTKAGDWKWILARGRIVERDENGRPVRMIGTHTDIHDRKLMEDALREREETFRALAENSVDTIIRFDADCRVLFINQVIEKQTGVPPGQFIGKTFAEAGLDADISEELEQAIRQVFREGQNHRREILLPDGRWIDRLLTPEFDAAGRVQAVISFARDISQSKAIHHELELSERKYRSIIESSPMGIHMYRLEEDGRLIFSGANPAANRILGVDHGQFIGKTIEEAFPPLVQTEVPDRYKEIARNGGYWVNSQVNYKYEKIHGAYDVYAFQASPGRVTVKFLDVTKRLLGEEKLRESEEKFRGMAESLLDVLFITNDEGSIDYISPASKTVFGYEPSEMVGTVFTDYLPADQVPSAMRLFAQIIGSGERVFNALYTMKRKDGAFFPGEVTASIVTKGDRIVGTLGLIRDVTERQRAEEAMRRTQFAMDHAKDSIMWIDSEGNIVYANDSACGSLGYTREELLRLKVFDIDPDFNEDQWDEHKRQMREKGFLSFESRHVKKDGTVFPVEVNTNYFSFDDQFFAIAFDRNISDRKQVEAVLREKEKRYQLLVQNSNDIVEIVDENGSPSYLSDQVSRILGYQVEELINLQAFDGIHPDDLPHVMEVFNEGLQHPGVLRKAEYRYRHKNGHWVHLEAVGSNLLHDPAVRGIVLNIRDMTDRVHAEQEQRKLQEQLQQAMKMEAVGRLAGGVAHDFNNLLTGISGNLQLALLDLKKSDPLTETLEEIRKAADSATALTRQLLAFSRKQIIEPKVLDLNELIEAMHKMLVRLIGEDIQLQTLAGEDLGVVKIDQGQFEQILVNLAVNARDAMPNGGKLIVETANVELNEEYCRLRSYSSPGAYVMLAVSDTGAGMSEEVKAHLFEPFFTTKEKGKGTGLGLATIYGAVKQAGGNVEVYSEEGKGTTFKVYLPRVEEKAEKPALFGRTNEMPGGKETILLVEDEEIVRNLAIKVLKRLGYKVLHADSGGDALLLAEQYNEPIHLLLTDVVMPVMNGRQLAERLSTIHPEAKVLFTSGYTENIIVHHGVIDEGVRFISKPYSPGDLAKMVRRTLDGATGPMAPGVSKQ
ncbi:MAG TPA: PAS domain S-box protein [bacterium]|nr:PAS domain S-box protein [bacterium]